MQLDLIMLFPYTTACRLTWRQITYPIIVLLERVILQSHTVDQSACFGEEGSFPLPDSRTSISVISSWALEKEGSMCKLDKILIQGLEADYFLKPFG
jgi:hypothetical protein